MVLEVGESPSGSVSSRKGVPLQDEGNDGLTGTESEEVRQKGKMNGVPWEEVKEAARLSSLLPARSLSNAAAASARVMLGPLAARLRAESKCAKVKAMDSRLW